MLIDTITTPTTSSTRTSGWTHFAIPTLGLLLAAPSSAWAGEFDGLYQVHYNQVTTDLKVCASYQNLLHCEELHVVAPLDEGLLTEESFQVVVDGWISQLETNTSHVVRPEVESAINELVALAYDQVAEQINVVLMTLPVTMDIHQNRAVPEVIQVILGNEEETSHLPAVGSLDPESGFFALPAVFTGHIDPLTCDSGWGSAALPLGFAVEDHGITVTVSGRVASTFSMERDDSEAPTFPSPLRH